MKFKENKQWRRGMLLVVIWNIINLVVLFGLQYIQTQTLRLVLSLIYIIISGFLVSFLVRKIYCEKDAN